MQQRHLLEDAGTELQALAWEAEQEQEYLRQVAGTEDLQQVISLDYVTDGGDAALSLSAVSQFLPKLRALKVDGSSISSLRCLGSGFQLLSVLRVERCCLCELDGAAALPALTELHAACNAVWDLAPLQDLTQLRVLDLSSNCVEDADMLLYLQDCTALHSLSLAANPVAAQEVYTSKAKHLLPQLKHLDQLHSDAPNNQPAAMATGQQALAPHAHSTTTSDSTCLSHRPSSSGSTSTRPTTATSSTPSRPASAGSLQHQGSGSSLRPGTATAGKAAVGLYWRKLRVDGIGNEADVASAAEGSTLSSDACHEATVEPAESSSQLTYGTNTALSGSVARGLRQRRQDSVTQKAAANSPSEQSQADIMYLESADTAEQRTGGAREADVLVCKGNDGQQQQSDYEQQQHQHQQAEQHRLRRSVLSASTSYSHPVVAGPPPGDPPTGLWRELQSKCSIASTSSGGDCSSRPWSSSSRPLSGSSRPLSGSSSRPLSSAGALGQHQEQRRQQQQLHKTVSEGSVAAAAWAPHTNSTSGPRVRSATATISSEPLQPALPVLQRRTSHSVRSTAQDASMQQLPLLAPRRQ